MRIVKRTFSSTKLSTGFITIIGHYHHGDWDILMGHSSYLGTGFPYGHSIACVDGPIAFVFSFHVVHMESQYFAQKRTTGREHTIPNFSLSRTIRMMSPRDHSVTGERL